MGACTKGESCSFAHTRSDLRFQPNLQKTHLCLAFQRNGTCRDGSACKYAHGVEDLMASASAATPTKDQSLPDPSTPPPRPAVLSLAAHVTPAKEQNKVATKINLATHLDSEAPTSEPSTTCSSSSDGDASEADSSQDSTQDTIPAMVPADLKIAELWNQSDFRGPPGLAPVQQIEPPSTYSTDPVYLTYNLGRVGLA